MVLKCEHGGFVKAQTADLTPKVSGSVGRGLGRGAENPESLRGALLILPQELSQLD